MVLACLRGEVLPITIGVVSEDKHGIFGTVLGTCGGKKRVILGEGDDGLCDNFPWNSILKFFPSFSSPFDALYLFEAAFVFLFPEKSNNNKITKHTLVVIVFYFITFLFGLIYEIIK